MANNFKSRADFIKAQTSEKITLAHVQGRKRLYTWVNEGGGIWSKVVPYFAVRMFENASELARVSSQVSVVAGTFYYDISTSTIYAGFTGLVDPTTIEAIVEYRFFYSSKGVALPWDLQDISEDVNYEGRIVASPGYKHKIGIDQALTSVVGEGTLQLKNQDGRLDDTFDTIIFENHNVTIYSWNPDLAPSEARVLFRGVVTNKTFDGIDVRFKIKDQIFRLLEQPDLEVYTDNDNVNPSVSGQYKRRIYGRVDGLRAQSIDQIGEGYPLTGKVSANANSTTLFGLSGTVFLTEVAQNDKIIVGTQEFTVASVQSDNQLTITDETEFSFFLANATLSPDRAFTGKNRTFLAAGHLCAEVNHTVINVLQLNRLEVSSTEGFFPGDFVEFVDTSERIQIKNVAPGNILVLQQNMVNKPAISSVVKRQPIQAVYINSTLAPADKYSVINTGNQCGITFTSDVEFDLARESNTAFDLVFTNGSATVTSTTTEVGLSEVIKPRDFIKPNLLTYTTYYEVINVSENSITLSTTFTDPTVTEQADLKNPEYINDDTIISVDILGKTVDGTANGEWIRNSSQVVKDLLTELNINSLNTASFDQAEEDGRQLISMAVPFDFSTKTLPTVKVLIDALNKSVNASLTLDNDLLLKHQILNVYTGEALTTIKDSDVIDWKIKSHNGKTFRNAIGRYRFQDVDRSSLEEGNSTTFYSSEYVERYVGTNKTTEFDLYLYDEFDAQISTHRNLYYNRLSVTTVTITTDLRLEDIEIGDVVILDFDRLYKRFGDSTTRKKVVLVTGKMLTGERTELTCSDLGNTFNSSSYITPNSAPDWAAASIENKLIYGYITDNQGIVNNEEDTAGTHLIS